MHGPAYVVTWILLLLLIALAAWKKRWWPLGAYVVGALILLNAVTRNGGEWDDLADFATLLVIVLPIYAIGSLLWLILTLADRRKRNKNKER